MKDVIVKVKRMNTILHARHARVVMSMVRCIEKAGLRTHGDCYVQDVCAVQETLDTKQVSELVADFLAGFDSCGTV